MPATPRDPSQAPDDRRERRRREVLERVAVGQHEPAEPGGMMGAHELAERTAGVVAYERDFARARASRPAPRSASRRRAETDRRPLCIAIRCEPSGRSGTMHRAPADSSAMSGSQTVGVYEQPVDQHDHGARSLVAIVNGPVREFDLRHRLHLDARVTYRVYGSSHTDSTDVKPGRGRAGAERRGSTPTRRPRTKAAQREATTAALIAAARPLFAERGYAGVGTEEIVQSAGRHPRRPLSPLPRWQRGSVPGRARTDQRRDDATGDARPRSPTPDPFEALVVGADAFLDACALP